MTVTSGKSTQRSGVVAICGNPNSGKTTIFNAITGLNQQVGNYPGVTVEKVTGRFESDLNPGQKLTLVDIPGSYSLSAFTPDEYIAAAVLFGEFDGQRPPDAIICVIDATQLERGFYLLLQILQIGCPTVVAVNMIDLAQQGGIRINFKRLSRALGGIPVVPVIGNRRKGIDKLKRETANAIDRSFTGVTRIFDSTTEEVMQTLVEQCSDHRRSRAQYLRVIFDENGQAEKQYVRDEGRRVIPWIEQGRRRIRDKFGSLVTAETGALTYRAEELHRLVVRKSESAQTTVSEKIDKYLLHPLLGPVVLVLLMVLVFQSIFSWAAPLMDAIDGAFSWLAGGVEATMVDGPLRSLLTDGVIGGVGSVLIFIPQIAILFIFIAILEDSGFMPRAAFLVDRMFRWCGLSGKSFIPMLSSFACAVPGIMATRTIEDRKLRLITIMVAPLMTCSARLPVYAIMIAAFIPYKTYLGIFNLQGLVLTMLYLLGIATAVVVSYILKKTFLKTERGTFMMEMPTYKLPTLRSIGIRVLNRLKSFLLRAGTIILAITVIIWALSYYPRSADVTHEFNIRKAEAISNFARSQALLASRIDALTTGQSPEVGSAAEHITESFDRALDFTQLEGIRTELIAEYSSFPELVETLYRARYLMLDHNQSITRIANEKAGAHIRGSFLGIVGRQIEPLFEPLGWDWKITVSVLAAFPAREVIIATLGTIYNLGTEIEVQSSSLIEKMRNAVWEDGPDKGKAVFSPAVAISIMVFFALCCQCGATLVTIRQETASWIYSVATFVYMTALAYLFAFTSFQIMRGAGF
ncbi:MAG: ferrous iron transport protein B [Candidatus Zixiibacteriota bacterium]|nr:MAG: ferrous iron transport protein B [candidate division Zixibacteria bacterium]